MYPPSPAECVVLFEELKRLDLVPAADFTPRKYEIIHDLAEAHFYDARPYFVEGLANPDPDYRWACISALIIHWKDSNSTLTSKVIAMAELDPDVQVRMIAVSSLGFLELHSAIPLLERIANSNTEDADVIGAAKDALAKL